MIQIIKDDIWRFQPHSYVIVPTNGFVKRNGECVMGAGLAQQAKIKNPKLPFLLGQKIEQFGNHVFQFHPFLIITFPVKSVWWLKADLKLIEQSSIELKELIKSVPGGFCMPKVGCGNGQLDWSQVEPIIEKYLPNVRVVDQK